MEKERFAAEIQKYKKEMFLLAYSILGNYHDSEDAVAETMLRAYEKIGTLKNEERFKPWLMKILVNRAHLVRRGNKRVIFVEEMDTYAGGTDEIISDLWETVLALEDDLRSIVVLYYYQGFSVREISQMLALPVGTVKSRMARAREKLKVMLG